MLRTGIDRYADVSCDVRLPPAPRASHVRFIHDCGTWESPQRVAEVGRVCGRCGTRPVPFYSADCWASGIDRARQLGAACVSSVCNPAVRGRERGDVAPRRGCPRAQGKARTPEGGHGQVGEYGTYLQPGPTRRLDRCERSRPPGRERGTRCRALPIAAWAYAVSAVASSPNQGQLRIRPRPAVPGCRHGVQLAPAAGQPMRLRRRRLRGVLPLWHIHRRHRHVGGGGVRREGAAGQVLRGGQV